MTEIKEQKLPRDDESGIPAKQYRDPEPSSHPVGTPADPAPMQAPADSDPGTMSDDEDVE